MAGYWLDFDGDPDLREVRPEVSRRKLDSTVSGLWRFVAFVLAVLFPGGLVDWLGLA